MSTVTAIYEHGVFRPLEKVDLPEHSRVELSLSAPLPEPDPATLDAVYASALAAVSLRVPRHRRASQRASAVSPVFLDTVGAFGRLG